MRRNSVSSSMIASVGYDFKANVLEVEFRRGDVFQYLNVPHGEYLALMSADSHGHYLHDHIRSKYSFRKLWKGK